MPTDLSTANSRMRRMMLLVSVLNTLATAMSAMMTVKHRMNTWIVWNARRVDSALTTRSTTFTVRPA